MIRRPEEFNSDFEVACDAVVVGSGPGGGAAAYKLAKLGRKVIVLEMGGYFTTGDFKNDGNHALKNLYQDSGQRFTHGNAFFATMAGKGVGGGGLINSAIAFDPPEKTVNRWADEAKLREFTLSTLKPYLSEVKQNVNIEVLPLDRLGRNNTIFKEGLDKLGYKGGVIPRITKNCRGCGICFYGCPSGAKQSVDKNFIARALELGVDVYIHAKVVRVDVDPKTKKFKSVFAVIQDKETGKTRARVTVNAKHLVCAAGAVGTAQILAREKICNSSGQVGRNYRCHPSTGVLGVFGEPINSSGSVMQGYYSDQFFDDDILLETFWAPSGVIATFIPGFGDRATALMKQYKFIAGAGGMIRDESSGKVSFDGPVVDIEYDVNERDQKLLTQAFYRSCEVLKAAGARVIYADNPTGQVIFTSMDEIHDFFKRNHNLGTDIIREGNHGMGTCRMGEDPKKSVVNSFGRAHDIDNVWVMDVSAFPGALGVNPQITIMALALRGAEYLHGHFS